MKAWGSYEVGMTGAKAAAESEDAMYFLEVYGRKTLRLGEPQKLTPMRGERNYLVYIPLGVGVVIPPWNFPCAIMAGLGGAWRVTGGTGGLEAAGGWCCLWAKGLVWLFLVGWAGDGVDGLARR